MGYWKMAGASSVLFESVPAEEITGAWGDNPADIIGDAIDAIVFAFEEDLGRKPTKQEIVNGLMFSLNVRDDLAEKIDKKVLAS